MLGTAWADYNFTQIDAANANATYVLGINNGEQVVGYTVDENSHHNHAFLLDFSGAYDQFDAPYAGVTDTVASGINDAGQVVGTYVVGFHSHGFALSDDYTMIDVPDGADTRVNGINNAGQIVGTVGPVCFLLGDDGFTEFSVPNAVNSGAFGINDTGQIVGSVRYDFVQNGGFVRDSDGSFSYFAVPGADFTFASGINNLGQVVGTYYGDGVHGFLLSDGQFTTIDVPGSSATYATGINDAGQIVGYFYDQNGIDVHGFIATPQ